MKDFSTEDYDRIKSVLKNEKISNKEIKKYLLMAELRHLRHKQELEATDEELEAVVNCEITIEDLRKEKL